MLTIWNYSYNWVLFHNLLYPFFFQMEIFQDLETFLINQVYYGERERCTRLFDKKLSSNTLLFKFTSNRILIEKASDPRHVDPIPQCAVSYVQIDILLCRFWWLQVGLGYIHVIDRSYRFGFYLFQKSYLPGLPIITILTYA